MSATAGLIVSGPGQPPVPLDQILGRFEERLLSRLSPAQPAFETALGVPGNRSDYLVVISDHMNQLEARLMQRLDDLASGLGTQPETGIFDITGDTPAQGGPIPGIADALSSLTTPFQGGSLEDSPYPIYAAAAFGFLVIVILFMRHRRKRRTQT